MMLQQIQMVQRLGAQANWCP